MIKQLRLEEAAAVDRVTTTPIIARLLLVHLPQIERSLLKPAPLPQTRIDPR